MLLAKPALVGPLLVYTVLLSSTSPRRSLAQPIDLGAGNPGANGRSVSRGTFNREKNIPYGIYS